MGIAAWLLARFGGASVIKIIEFIGVALIAFAFVGLLYSGVLHLEDLGAKKQAVRDDHVLKICADDKRDAIAQRDQALAVNTELGAKLKLANAGVAEWKGRAAEAQQRAARETAARQAIAKLHNVKIVADAAIVKGPAAATKEKACEDAAGITDSLVRDLVQQH